MTSWFARLDNGYMYIRHVTEAFEHVYFSKCWWTSDPGESVGAVFLGPVPCELCNVIGKINYHRGKKIAKLIIF